MAFGIGHTELSMGERFYCQFYAVNQRQKATLSHNDKNNITGPFLPQTVSRYGIYSVRVIKWPIALMYAQLAGFLHYGV